MGQRSQRPWSPGSGNKKKIQLGFFARASCLNFMLAPIFFVIFRVKVKLRGKNVCFQDRQALKTSYVHYYFFIRKLIRKEEKGRKHHTL